MIFCIMLILCGSHAGMIVRELLSPRAPLYGRATEIMPVNPLPFGALVEFFPDYSADDRAVIYACLGGVPQYLELLDPSIPALDNLKERLLTAPMILNDAGFLLRDQLGEPRNYVAVVEAIAANFQKIKDIARMAGLQSPNVSKYLADLQTLDIIQRIVPATVRHPERSHRGRYVLADHYLRFYYRFLAPARSNLERGLVEEVARQIETHLPAFIGQHVFEELCREWVARDGDAGRLPLAPNVVGSYWVNSPTAPQVDVVAINWNKRLILLGECKWTKTPITGHVVSRLIEKTDKVLPKERGRPWTVFYAFFSRAGFTPDAREAAAGKQVLWIDWQQMERDLRRAA